MVLGGSVIAEVGGGVEAAALLVRKLGAVMVPPVWERTWSCAC